MELAREERRLRAPKNWGIVAYERIKEREREIKEGGGAAQSRALPLDSSVRAALETHATVRGPLDASSLLQSLCDEELCLFFGEYTQLESLALTHWQTLSASVCRAISIACAATLVELDLSHSAVSATHMELLCVRAAGLQVLRLNSCPNVDVQCAALFVPLLAHSLRELSLSRCARVSNDVCYALGGTSPSGLRTTLSLHKLRLLDLSHNALVGDEGVLAIAQNCRRLEAINLENCAALTDRSLVPLATQNPRVRLAVLSGVSQLTNKTVLAIAKSWSSLVSLDLSRCTNVSDKALVALALRCPKLQALSLAGLRKVSEQSMFSLADRCPGLLSLNLTGCERITSNGLSHLLRGLPHVRPGVTFTGFRPTDEHVEEKLNSTLRMLETTSLRQREEREKEERERVQREIDFKEERERHAACVIQAYMTRYHKRMYFYDRYIQRTQRENALLIQRVYRGYRGRRRAALRKIERDEFIALTPFALRMQRRVRGFLTRVHTKHVSQKIREMYDYRLREVRHALAVRLQAQCRRYLAKERVARVRELTARRHVLVDHAVCMIQLLARRFIAKLRVHRRRVEARNREEARRIAGKKIYTFCVEGIERYKSKLTTEELRRYYRHKWTAAILIQRLFRGHRARELVLKKKVELATRYYAAREIQRVFRGSRVLHWRDLRLNVIAAYVLDRHYVERQRSIVESAKRYREFVIENQRDSASEPDEEEDEEVLKERDWVEGFDKKKQRKFWQNFVTNEITFDEPQFALAHERGMIGKRVRVFWVVHQQWYEGTIARYHRRKKRHRIEYDDGDHEWIDLRTDGERVQVQLPDGGWVLSTLYNSEAQLEENRKLDEKRQRDAFKAQAFQDAMQWKAFVDDRDGQTILFLSQITGELRTGNANAMDWVVQDDGHGFPCFFNLKTQNVVYEDPRFTDDVDEDLMQQRLFVMQELRMCVYLCGDLWDEYTRTLAMHEGNPMHREVVKVLLKVKNSPKPTQLNSFLIRARALFQPSSIVDKPMDRAIGEELDYAAWLGARLSELLEKAEQYIRDRKDAKRKVVEKLTEQSGKVIYCSNCKRETKKHLAFCPHCGKQQILV